MSEQFEESYNHLIEKLEGWMDVFVTNIPNLIVASLVFASAYYLSGFIRSQLEKRLRGHVSDPALRSLIATMSSGSFGGLPRVLLERLRADAPAPPRG